MTTDLVVQQTDALAAPVSDATAVVEVRYEAIVQGSGLIVVYAGGKVIGSWRPTGFRMGRFAIRGMTITYERAGSHLERFDIRTPEVTRSLAERARQSPSGYAAVNSKEIE